VGARRDVGRTMRQQEGGRANGAGTPPTEPLRTPGTRRRGGPVSARRWTAGARAPAARNPQGSRAGDPARARRRETRPAAPRVPAVDRGLLRTARFGGLPAPSARRQTSSTASAARDGSRRRPLRAQPGAGEFVAAGHRTGAAPTEPAEQAAQGAGPRRAPLPRFSRGARRRGPHRGRAAGSAMRETSRDAGHPASRKTGQREDAGPDCGAGSGGGVPVRCPPASRHHGVARTPHSATAAHGNVRTTSILNSPFTCRTPAPSPWAAASTGSPCAQSP